MNDSKYAHEMAKLRAQYPAEMNPRLLQGVRVVIIIALLLVVKGTTGAAVR